MEKQLLRHIRKLEKRIKKLKGGKMGKPVGQVEQLTRLNEHDLKVILFHVAVAAIQAALLQLKLENFGTLTPMVVMVVQVVSEALRRIVV